MYFSSYLISPNSEYGQSLSMVLTMPEIEQLYKALRKLEDMGYPLPNSIKDLRCELWYMLTETKEFNAYLKEGGEP